MDKYEYQLKTEHIRQVAARKEYEEAARLCDTIDWTKVRDVKMLTFAADIYTAVGEYENAIDILQQAYEYTTMGRRIVYRLTELALKAGNYDEAKNYFEEFCRIAPNDQGRYILLYKMARFQKATLEEKIQILEAYKKEDFDEKWAYELAVLYAMNNEKDKCIQLCDDIILWFGLGKYVEKALSLKSQFAPLTSAQKEKVQKFADKKAKEENEKLQKEQDKKEKQEVNQAQKEETQKQITKWQREQEEAYRAEQEAAKEEARAREAEQIAAREREEQLRMQREKEKALKEEREREEARKAAERLHEQKEREEQERLQREQEELEAVERLKQAQKKEHSKLNVVTSDMNEIMAVIQRARQEDAQNDLQESLAKEIQEVQKQVAAEEVEKAEEPIGTETIEEVETGTMPETESEQVEADEIEEPETEEIESEEAEEPEAEEIESEETEEPEKIQPEETDEMPEITSEITASVEETLEEPQISEWAAPQAETVTFEEAEAAEAPDLAPADITLDEVQPEEYPEIEPEKEESKEEAFEPEEEVSEIDVEEDESTEVPKETESVEDEETQEVQQTTESDKESDLETPAEQYEEFRQTERVRADGIPIVNPENMSRVWHFAIQAMPDEDDIELALDYLQELSDSSSRVVPQSVVKTTGQKLNQKGVVRSFDKLLGKTILIENAADMSDRVIDELCQVIEPNDRSLLVVFIDTPSSIRHLLLDHPALSSVITAQFVRENYSVTELLEYARGYADREDSVLDKSGELALMERLKVIAENQERNKKRIVEMIVNNAIEKAEKKSVRRLFQSKYDKQGCLILRDKDFQVS